MAFVDTTVLVEIQPDASKFEAQLKRQLETALRSVEASASSTLKINLQASTGPVKQIERISVVSQDATLALQSVARSLDIMIRSSQQATKELGALEKGINVVGAVSRGIEIVTRVASNIATVIGFTAAIKGLGETFGKEALKAEGFVENAKALGRALANNFLPTDQAAKVNRGLAEDLERSRSVAERLGRTYDTLPASTQKAAAATQTYSQFVASGAKISENANKTLLGQSQAVKQVATETVKTSPIIAKLKDETGALGLNFLKAKDASKDAKIEFTTLNAITNLTSRIFEGIKNTVRSAGSAIADAGASAVRATADFLATNVAGGIFAALGRAAKGLLSTIASLAKEVFGLGGAFGTLGPLAATGVAAAGLGIFGVAAVGVSKKIIGAAQAASSLQESTNAVNVTLGSASKKFFELIGTSSDLGLSQSRLNAAITPIVPLLKNAGLRGDDLAISLNKLVRRAVDVASIFNVEVDRALGAFGAGLRGETEPLERLGISFNALSVDLKATELGFKRVGGQFSESAKQIARFELIIEKSKDTAGDFARTSTSLANAQRVLGARIDNVKTGISEAFLPAAEALINAFSEFVKVNGPDIIALFKELSPIFENLAELFLTALPVIKTFGEVFKISVLPVISQLIKLFNFLGPILQFVLARFLLLRSATTAVLALQGALALLTRILPVLTGALSFVRAGVFFLGQGITAILSGPIGLLIIAIGLISLKTRDTVKDFKALDKAGAETGDALAKEFEKQVTEVGLLEKGVIALSGALGTISPDLFGLLDTTAEKAVANIQSVFAQSPERAKKAVADLQKGLSNLSPEVVKAVTDAFNDLNAAQERSNAELAKSNELAEIAERSLTALADALSASTSTSNSLLSASGALRNAIEQVAGAEKIAAEATKTLNDLQTERAQILRDTITPLQETAAAERDLVSIRAQLRDIDQDLVASEKELALLRNPATLAEKIEESDRAIARATIAVNRALRAQLATTEELTEAQQEGLVTEQATINLAGLSIDQIRTKLSNIRETLKLQRESAKTEKAVTKDTKTQDELDEESLSKVLDVADAQKVLKDLIAGRQTLESNHAIEIRELEERIEGLQISRLGTLDQQRVAQNGLNALIRGETTLAKELKAVDDQITAAKESQKTTQETLTKAVEAQKLAEIEITIEQAKATGNINLQIAAQKELNALKAIQLGADERTVQLLGEANNRIDNEITALEERNRIVNSVSPAESGFRFGDPIPLGGTINDFGNFTSGITNPVGGLAEAGKILSDSALGLSAIINEIIRQTGVNVRPLAHGGVIESETFAKLGEGGRREVVLPLTRPARLADLLSDSKVLSPVLNALARVTLPRASASVPTLLDLLPSTPPLQARIGSGGRQGSGSLANEQEKRKSDRQLAKMIAEELIAAGVSSGKTTDVGGIHVKVENANPKLAAWLAAKSIQRALSRI